MIPVYFIINYDKTENIPEKRGYKNTRNSSYVHVVVYFSAK